jgi:hypothetical protein
LKTENFKEQKNEKSSSFCRSDRGGIGSGSRSHHGYNMQELLITFL